MRLYIDDTSNGVGDYVLQSNVNGSIAGGALVQSSSRLEHWPRLV